MPKPWVARLEAINAEKAANAARTDLGGGDEPPHDPPMEARVAKLEVAFASLADKLDNLATKTDLERLNGGINTLNQRMEGGFTAFGAKVDGDLKAFGAKLDGQDKRLGMVETAVTNVGNKLDAKMISGGQMFGIFLGLLTAFFVFGGIAIGILKYFGMLR